MSATNPPSVAELPPPGTALRCVAVVVWGDEGPRRVDEAGPLSGAAAEAIVTRRPIWVQLALPRLTPEQQAWFEGSVEPWDRTEAPELDWSAVNRVLELVGLGASALDRHEQRLLQRIPHLYGRGVARVGREVWGRQGRHSADLRFFPTVAFRPIEDSELPAFWTVRMAVGVIRNVVVTMRLPDLRWLDASEEFDYEPGDAVEVAERFFPAADDLTADDVADAIGLQQASTARAVSGRMAAELRRIERAWRHDVRSAEARENGDPGDARRVVELTEHLYQLDRQLSRLLRRFELDGAGGGPFAASDIALRYRFALDELRSLEGNCRLASQTIAQAIKTADQVDRERFQFLAAVLASAILVPTLVASIYGANVELPARDSWRGFIALILFITSFALIGLSLISKALPHDAMTGTRWLSRFSARIAKPVVAAAAFLGGVMAAAWSQLVIWSEQIA